MKLELYLEKKTINDNKLLIFYCQSQKTVNTWKISGLFIVKWPITIKFRTREQTLKPETFSLAFFSLHNNVSNIFLVLMVLWVSQLTEIQKCRSMLIYLLYKVWLENSRKSEIILIFDSYLLLSIFRYLVVVKMICWQT